MNYQFPSFRDFGHQKMQQLQIQTEWPQSSNLYCSRHENLEAYCKSASSQSHVLNMADPQFQRSPRKEQEISFEAHILTQHQIAFDKETKNFMENFYTLSKINILETQFEGKSNSNMYQHVQFSSQFVIPDRQSYKRKEQSYSIKLLEFFSYVRKTAPQQLIPWLCFLWEILKPEYSRMQDLMLSEQEITIQSNRLANQKYHQFEQNHSILLLLLYPSPQSSPNSTLLPSPPNPLKKSLIQYIQFFFTTILLINQQYFCNPYCSAEMATGVGSFRVSSQFLGLGFEAEGGVRVSGEFL